MVNTQILQQSSENPIMLCAILSYINPLHHPTPEGTIWSMSHNRPINYRSEVEPTEDQRIRDDKGVEKGQKEGKSEVDKPEKEDENIDVPNTEEGEPEDLPDTEDPNKAKDDVKDI
ncbi:hypothetical protein M8998_06115 [Sphingobacterium sp. lm-10]|uniref:hypothetical protein n=1 Tax=Sphingobacterium sp. lm-10 TaxID=2944904 RepID=UPI002020D428|nr:hypothetical protein [Sphingobacterium sp. lm-10]MCL7987507.1 hypothetical protein [Sphingobacterium sp. lm-10]